MFSSSFSVGGTRVCVFGVDTFSKLTADVVVDELLVADIAALVGNDVDAALEPALRDADPDDLEEWEPLFLVVDEPPVVWFCFCFCFVRPILDGMANW